MLVRVGRIELPSYRWQRYILPLNYTRIYGFQSSKQRPIRQSIAYSFIFSKFFLKIRISRGTKRGFSPYRTRIVFVFKPFFIMEGFETYGFSTGFVPMYIGIRPRLSLGYPPRSGWAPPRGFVLLHETSLRRSNPSRKARRGLALGHSLHFVRSVPSEGFEPPTTVPKTGMISISLRGRVLRYNVSILAHIGKKPKLL